jgi:hypothetical protein
VAQLGRPWELEQVRADACGIKPYRLLGCVRDDLVEEVACRLATVDIGDVCAQDERRFGPRKPLQERCLPGRKLDRVGPGRDQNRDRLLQVLDTVEESRLAEEAVVDGNVEAPPIGGEQTVQTRVQASSPSLAKPRVSARSTTSASGPAEGMAPRPPRARGG